MLLESINKTYHNHNEDIQALNNINLYIQEKGMIFIVGQSGCGKTSLLHIISGKDNDFTGHIERDGKIEVVEQDILLMESMKVIDNLLIVNNNRQLIDEWLEKFHMKEFVHQKVKKLSVGQKKRIQIIRSLLVESDYLICDEPTASLDYENAEIIMEILQTISQDKSVIIVTHEVALIEKYADRIITMKKGKVVNDKVVNEKEQLIINKISDISKSNNQRLRFLIKSLKCHPVELISKFCLIFLILIIAFVCTSLFSSTREAVIEKNKWRNSENLIITQPHEDNNKYRGVDDRVEEDGSYLYYDIYDKKTLQLVKDNISQVIGYRYGWTPQNYSLSNGSFTPEMTIDDIKEAVIEGDRIYQETGEVPFADYDDFCRILDQANSSHPNGDFPKDFVLTFDFRNYEGFKDNSFSNAPAFDIFKIGNKKNTEVVSYQLYDRYEISLQYGYKPVHNNEIIVSLEVAAALTKEYQLDSYKQLIGKEMPFSYFGGEETKVQISGISYTENKNENQIYFKEGALDEWIEEAYQMIPDKLKYIYVYFLIDPQYNAEKVANDINKTIVGRESSFIPYNNSFLTESQEYQNPAYFYLFSSLVCIGLLIIEVGMILACRKRYIKEEKVMRSYGYSPIFYIFGYLILLFVTVIGLQMLMLPYLCQIFNQFVNTLGFASFVEYNIFNYLLSTSVALIFIVIIEGGLYAFRTQKHS